MPCRLDFLRLSNQVRTLGGIRKPILGFVHENALDVVGGVFLEGGSSFLPTLSLGLSEKH
jgi:hypothetical protein